jgi:hypothetical protein
MGKWTDRQVIVRCTDGQANNDTDEQMGHQLTDKLIGSYKHGDKWSDG